MSEKFNSRVSAEGAALIADAVINNTKMSFLKAYGSTTEFADAQLPKLTDKDLTGASHNQNGHISNVSVDKDTNTVRTEIVLDGSTVEADYGLNSILMVATVDGKEHLFAVLKANQTQYMNAYDGKSSTNLQINCSFIISNTDVVDILKVDSAGTLTRADYDELHKFTVDQVAITVTNVNKYTDASVSKEADIRLAADIDEIKARSDADDIERKARIAADNTESKARAAADDAAAKDLSTLKGTVSTNYTNATIYADGAVNKEAAIRLAADNTESKARSDADTWETGQRTAADTTETNARIAADNAETQARSAADTAETKIRATADDALTASVKAAQKTVDDTIKTIAGKTYVIGDRFTALTPQQYLEDYLGESVTEWKYADLILGNYVATNPWAGGIGHYDVYGYLHTDVSQGAGEGNTPGTVMQEFKCGWNSVIHIFVRTNSTKTTWTAWNELTQW